MKRKRLMWQFFPPQIALSLISLGALTWFVTGVIHDAWFERAMVDLETKAELVSRLAAELDLEEGIPDADRFCKDIGRQSRSRVTLILLSGRVVGDTEEDPATMDNHGDRPEIRAAFSGDVGRSTRFSQTLREDRDYIAIPWRQDGRIVGAVRLSLSRASVYKLLQAIYLSVIVAGGAIALVTVAAAWALSRKVSGRLESIRRGAERFARGDFSRPLPAYQTEELAALARTMNQMAADLNDRIQTVTRQRNEHEAIFSSMDEGVVAVDANERLIALNDAAAALLEIDRSVRMPRSVQELIRGIGLQKFISRALASGERMEEEIVLREEPRTILEIRATPLREPSGARGGVLIVFNDVTRLRRLEGIRSDFVANVSHELRTPITSIKGFVETLRDGALEDKEDARRFLEILSRQADRLNAIIVDLLALSRIEQDARSEEIQMEDCRLRKILASAIDLCRLKAEEKGMSLELICEASVAARVNAPLIEQAVANLIDNAIKYSDPDHAVQVTALLAEDGVTISVRDHGRGIAKEHHSRLFERFYRVDKARSRKLGGTGLGLAIVKHVAQAHGGRVSVDSELDAGSCFTIWLPRAKGQ